MKLNALVFAGMTTMVMSSCSDIKNSLNQGPNPVDTTKLSQLQFTVEPAPEWTNLFKRTSGWFGGDGIFAITQNGKESAGASGSSETFIWFSDTILGEVAGDSLKAPLVMINNSMAILNGGQANESSIDFRWDSTTENKPAALFIPRTPATKEGDYYWLGDGFVNHKKNNDLYIFGYRIHNTTGGGTFGFEEVGNTIIIVPAGERPPFKNYRQVDVPFFLGRKVDSTGSFGAGVLVNTKEAGASNPDGYIYVYGVRGKTKNVMVARFLPEDIEAFDKWTFWSGRNWTSDPHGIQTITDRVSNELSVTPLGDGRYAMIFQVDGLGRNVGLRLGATPFGPFGPIINVYDASKELENDKDIFPYNAKAHPVLSKPNELLISFNVNSFDFFNDIKTFPNLYRPRFIRMKYELN
jgi:hypothetical protein